MIELIPLGIYGGVPKLNEACNGYLLKINGKNILVDCGTGVAAKLQEHIKFSELDAIILTHLHMDHFSDIFYISNAMKVANVYNPEIRESDILLIFPHGTEEDTYEWKLINKQTGFSVDCFNPDETQELFNGINLSAMITNHDRENYALVFEDTISKKKIGFTGDTGVMAELELLFKDVDILVSESSLLEKHKSDKIKHMTVKEACNLAKKSNAGLTLLTHFWYEIELEKYEEEITQSNVQIIKVNESYKIF